MYELVTVLPSLVLVVMIALTLMLLPLLDDERPLRNDRQQTDHIRLPRRPR